MTQVRWCWRYSTGHQNHGEWHDAKHRAMLERRCERFMLEFPDEKHWVERKAVD